MLSRRVDPRLLPAKARLDTLDYFPEPVRLEGVRVRVSPLLFKILIAKRFHGVATRRTIWLADERYLADEGLLTHELCHVWQGQQEYWRWHKTYLTTPYDENPYEAQAREAVRATATEAPARGHLRLVSA